jgi:hypothetical protein
MSGFQAKGLEPVTGVVDTSKKSWTVRVGFDKLSRRSS